jgi:23S rRNA (cytosine1962-C5)-methyltransferase
MNEYELLDSGHGRKLERFGKVTLDRPCAQAVWNPSQPALWKQADAFF